MLSVTEWVKEWVTLWNYGGFVPVPKRSESRWQKNSAAWPDTSLSLTVCFLPFIHSHFSTATKQWRYIHAYAQLMKPLLCCWKQWPSQRCLSLSFLLPTLFHPHGRWTEVKAKLCSLTASLLQCCFFVYVLMKKFCFFSFTEPKPLKQPAALPKSVFLLSYRCMERWGWEDVVNDTNEIWAKVWLGLITLRDFLFPDSTL